MLEHFDSEIAATLRKLADQLCQWERSTGRESLLIFREVPGNLSMHEQLRGNSDFVIRLVNGVSVDPASSDLADSTLAEPFGGR